MRIKTRKKEVKMIDMSQIQTLEVANSMDDIKDLDLNGLAENLSYYLKHKTNKVEREKVYQILRRIEEFTPLSYEYLMYLLETSNNVSHTSAIGRVGSNLARIKTRPMIRKIKAILKEYHQLVVVPTNKYCRTLTNIRGSLMFSHTSKVFHFLDLQNKP